MRTGCVTVTVTPLAFVAARVSVLNRDIAPRTNNSSTHPHNKTRPAIWTSRVEPSADERPIPNWFSREVLRKTVIGRQ